MQQGAALLAEVAIRAGWIMVRTGVRKLLPIVAEKLDAPELLELNEIVGLNEIQQLILEVVSDYGIQSKE